MGFIFPDSMLDSIHCCFLRFETKENSKDLVSEIGLDILWTSVSMTFADEKSQNEPETIRGHEAIGFQDLLDFMSRCQLGFFVNDMRVSNAAVSGPWNLKLASTWIGPFGEIEAAIRMRWISNVDLMIRHFSPVMIAPNVQIWIETDVDFATCSSNLAIFLLLHLRCSPSAYYYFQIGDWCHIYGRFASLERRGTKPSTAQVMKFTYVWVAVFFTILSWSAERIFWIAFVTKQ